MRDFEGEGEHGEYAAGTPVPPGNPPDRNSVAVASRYAQPESDSALTSSGENPAHAAIPLDRTRVVDRTGAVDRVDAVDRVEIEKLREMLREQQQATMRAVHAAADLQGQLSTAQTEVEKIGKKYYGFSKQAGAANARKAAEIERLHAHWHQTTLDLDKQKQERKAEAIRATAKLSDLRKELAAAGVPGISGGTFPRHGSENRRFRRAMIAVATAVAIVGSGVVFWRASITQSPAHRHPSAEARASDAPVAILQTATEHPSKSPPLADSTGGLLGGLSSEPTAAFTSALTGLDFALSSFPGREPEDVLREASKTKHACMLQWNDGHPSLIFGSGPSQSNSLSSTITQCAEAVKRLH